MRKFVLVFLCALIFAPAFADLGAALDDARDSCVGISEDMRRLQVITGVGTAVTGVGTVAAGGALIVGIQKARNDRRLEEITKRLERLEQLNGNMSREEFFHLLLLMADWKAEDEKERAELAEQSVRLGHWRTGLIAGGTIMSIGGAVIAHRNKNEGAEIEVMIRACLESASRLQAVSIQALFDGETDARAMTRARNITDACSRFSIADAERIPKRQDIAKWASIVGIGTGLGGTATSIAANTQAVRQGEGNHERNLNIAANVLAGATAVTGAVATGFNAATLASIGRLLRTAEDCERALQ